MSKFRGLLNYSSAVNHFGGGKESLPRDFFKSPCVISSLKAKQPFTTEQSAPLVHPVSYQTPPNSTAMFFWAPILTQRSTCLCFRCTVVHAFLVSRQGGQAVLPHGFQNCFLFSQIKCNMSRNWIIFCNRDPRKSHDDQKHIHRLFPWEISTI